LSLRKKALKKKSLKTKEQDFALEFALELIDRDARGEITWKREEVGTTKWHTTIQGQEVSAHSEGIFLNGASLIMKSDWSGTYTRDPMRYLYQLHKKDRKDIPPLLKKDEFLRKFKKSNPTKKDATVLDPKEDPGDYEHNPLKRGVPVSEARGIALQALKKNKARKGSGKVPAFFGSARDLGPR